MAHCNPCSQVASSGNCESLPSSLENFILHFFGEITRTKVDGKFVWILPCDLETGIAGNPRLEGEGLACYFKRLFENGLSGLEGPQGDPGADGADGADGSNSYSVLATPFTQPAPETPNITINLVDAAWVPVGSYVFVEGSGWYQVTFVNGGNVSLQLLIPVAMAGTEIPVGVKVSPAGPRGAAGAAGSDGADGADGADGDDGEDGLDAFTETVADFTQPVEGATVSISVGQTEFVGIGQTLFVETGGVYIVVSKGAGTIVLQNLYPAPVNATAGDNIAAGSVVTPGGVGNVVGPSSLVSDNSIVRFNGTGGQIIQGSNVLVDDDGNRKTILPTLAGPEFDICKVMENVARAETTDDTNGLIQISLVSDDPISGQYTAVGYDGILVGLDGDGNKQAAYRIDGLVGKAADLAWNVDGNVTLLGSNGAGSDWTVETPVVTAPAGIFTVEVAGSSAAGTIFWVLHIRMVLFTQGAP